MNCKYLLKRSKNYKLVFYCKLNKRYIDYKVDCINCLKKEYKTNKGINKVSNKKICVSKETYQIVYARDNGRCRLCGTTQNLHLHHILGRGKDLTDNPNNCIMLCQDCHLNKVHKNQKKYRPILLELINKNK